MPTSSSARQHPAPADAHQHGEDGHGHHHEMPTQGRALTGVALSATLHCLTGCAIGEVLGMVIGTTLGLSEWATVGLAVTLAFLFGYGLTSLPLLRAGFALRAVIPIALAADTLSIAIMEIIDNGIMLAIPGAMEAGVGSVLFWGSLSFALVIAGAVALPVNRWLIARGKGHAVVHATGIHGGPSPRLVGAIAVVGFIFGSAVLLTEVLGSDDGAGHESMAGRQTSAEHTTNPQAAPRAGDHPPHRKPSGPRGRQARWDQHALAAGPTADASLDRRSMPPVRRRRTAVDRIHDGESLKPGLPRPHGHERPPDASFQTRASGSGTDSGGAPS